MSKTIRKKDWFSILKDGKRRSWEQIYRNRWQHDRVVRSTHGVNCTGSCSWNILVKDGVITGELQATDYPAIGGEIPLTEPRGCPRGISTSWYVYSPHRIKYPYVRGALLDRWRRARSEHADPVDAWAAVVEDPAARRAYTSRRGKGGFRRSDWDEVLEIIAASNLYTIEKYGPDRIIGFSPIPAMSQVSYAAGSRYLNLIGGVVMSFYDWYCDLPAASPQVWGEQTDVCESADWYNAGYTVVMGSNVSVTRTPDAHYLNESRYSGTKVVVLSPDHSVVCKTADRWLPVRQGEDAAFWMAVNHVILEEFYHERRVEGFLRYACEFTDLPYLVHLEAGGDGGHVPGRFVRAGELPGTGDTENGDWKFVVLDETTGEPRVPLGSLGFRHDTTPGRWRLENTCGLTGEPISPQLSFLADGCRTVAVALPEFQPDGTTVTRKRHVPVREIATASGPRLVTTVFDLLNARLGVGRGLPGDYPADYADPAGFTPAWQRERTGLDPETVIQVAREFAANAERTGGRSMIIVGAGVNHWYHQDLIYRSAITALVLTGSVGVNGGGLAHYVGQEKVAMLSAWAAVAMAADWQGPPRLQNTPTFWYMHSGQWRYEDAVFDYYNVPDRTAFREQHAADFVAKAARLGWLPFYPNFDRNPLELGREADPAAAVVAGLQDGSLRFAVEDPDHPRNWPRVWFIWRGNAIASSAKGHEYFLKHVLGTTANLTAAEAAGSARDVARQTPIPDGKLDLVVDINFRMDTSALYSDIVLPAATWYEKNDLSTTDMHSFVHPLQRAVGPLWESRNEWDTFRSLAETFSRLARDRFPEPVRDVVAVPLLHDTPGEIAQPDVRDWRETGEAPVPGRTMPRIAVLERDYTAIHEKFVALGGNAARKLGSHGLTWDPGREYAELRRINGEVAAAGELRPALSEDTQVARAILHLAPETNGEVGVRAFAALAEKTGRDLAGLAAGRRQVRHTWEDIVSQPRRLLTSPVWTGIVEEGRPYSAFNLNTDHRVPWRTLTGRQHCYLDHRWYLLAGEALPVYKPNLPAALLRELEAGPGDLVLNYLTPHGKWHIHSTFYDNIRLLTLSRGGQVAWLNSRDAAAHGIADNDWLEIRNDNGVVVCRAVVSTRVAPGTCMIYHATERTLDVPLAPGTGNRAGNHNSLTRVRLKPLLMVGGYGQFSWGFNYWGPVGVNRDSYVVVRRLESVRY